MNRYLTIPLSIFLSFAFVGAAAAGKPTFDRYHPPDEVISMLKSWNSRYPELTKLINIGQSSGRDSIFILRLAASAKGSPEPDSRPAVFVSANLEGVHLVGTEAALFLIEKILSSYGSEEQITSLLQKKTIYAAPLLNPEAAKNFFMKPRYERRVNSKPIDGDLDGFMDEDGPDDLNKDGLITRMRVKDPEGKWIQDPTDPRLMRKADPEKGEKGTYKIYTEGLDNDGDGKYNEDPAGGIELNRNFPHDFEYSNKAAGLWPVSAKETINLVKFLTDHPNIAMVLNFSGENTILNLQQTGKAAAARDKVKVPKRFATFLGLDPDKEYSLKEIVKIVKESGIGRGMEIDESLVAMFLGLGPAVTIDKQDMPYLEAIQKEYKDALKEAKIDYPQKRAKGVGRGSFAAYCYYQMGVQVFSSDLWAIPEPEKKEDKDSITVDRLKTMSADEFLALGEEKIQAFLEEQGAPPNFSASMLIKMLESGRITPPKMAEMMEKMPKKPSVKDGEHPDSYIIQWSDSVLKGKGFVPWTSYQHPTLGDVEIGGFVPYLKINPPPSAVEKAVSFHADFYLKLMNRLPELAVEETRVKALEEGLYQVTVYFTNTGWFPTSSAQGRRARTAWPITVRVMTAKDQNVFSGRPIETIPFIDGGGDTKKVEWTIQGKRGSKVTVTARSPKLGSVEATVLLK